MCSVEPMSRDWVCYLSRRTSANPTVSHLGRYCASALAQAASKNRQAGDIEFAVHACRLGARCRKSSQNPKSCPNVSPAACRSGKKKQVRQCHRYKIFWLAMVELRFRLGSKCGPVRFDTWGSFFGTSCRIK